MMPKEFFGKEINQTPTVEVSENQRKNWESERPSEIELPSFLDSDDSKEWHFEDSDRETEELPHIFEPNDGSVEEDGRELNYDSAESLSNVSDRWESERPSEIELPNIVDFDEAGALEAEKVETEVETGEAETEKAETDAGEVETRESETNEESDDVKGTPRSGGIWTGERGNSTWCPEKSDIPQKANPDNKTWGDILAQFGIEGIEYKNGEPDFDPISKGKVEIDEFSTNRADNFDEADMKLAKQRGCSPEEVKKWRKENGYTWHECKDMKTMQKVPSVVHNNMPHCGGISEAKKGE
jgi:hypothetical protein